MCVAIAATVATVATTAYTAYSASQSQKAMAEAQSKRPGVIAAQFDDPSDAYSGYYKDVAENYGPLSEIAQRETDVNNTSYRRSISQVDSTALPNVEKQGKVTQNLLNGRLPKDVREGVTRDAAYSALLGGYGSDSGAAHALTARDLGTTTLALQKEGSDMLGANLANARSLTPYSVTADQLMLTPKELLSRSDEINAYNAGIANKNQDIKFGNSLAATAASTYNPTGAAISSGIGALAGSGLAKSYSTPTYGASQQVNATGYYDPYRDASLYNDEGTYLGANSFGGG